MKNSFKILALCGLIFTSSTKLLCMQQIPVWSLIEEESVFIETEHTKIKLAFIGKARVAEKAWQKALKASEEADQALKDAYIADKKGLDTFDALDRKSDNADKIMRDVEIQAYMVTAQAKQLYREAKALSVTGIKLAWAKVKKAKAAYSAALD
jgi:hypothetical protein